MRLFICFLGVVLVLTMAPAAGATGGLQQDAPPVPAAQRDSIPWLGTGLQSTQAGPDAPAANIVPWARFVFQSYRDNNWEIYRANPDGSGVVRLTNNPALDRDPRLNRGATRIVFASDRAGGDFDIFAMTPDGSGVTPLTSDSTDDLSPVWSADGTRIAFETYRHGINNGEVYVMNPNGGSQTRLTNSPGYDGLPSWSPDGGKIAFVSNRSGRYRIMVMNADGSNQQALSNQQNAFDPAWSPDGSQIAYDADDDGDNREELWLMNADGSNQRVIFDPSGDVVAWAHSWSPDGRYVAFSQIAVTVYQGNLYWTSGRVRVWDSANPGSVQDLTPGNVEWKPDLASVDAAAPSSSVQALPAQSPWLFVVRWAGTDSGGAGLGNYDVQVKDGTNGSWIDWKTGTNDTSGPLSGIGGHTYYFRSRARDAAFNTEAWPVGHDALTTVENLPPQTSVEALPEYSRTGLEVRWGGVDPGGSGIKSYDVQTRQDNGSWTNWKTNTTDTAAAFTGPAGSTIRFRARARDNAENLEAWPDSADATTVLYTWGITGAVTDNRGAPVVGMQTTTSPAAFHTVASDGDGNYAAHVATPANPYVATWSKAGYGNLPSTGYDSFVDAYVDVVLPPSENLISNGDFEAGLTGWATGGETPPGVATSNRHSGNQAARLGVEPAQTPPTQIAPNLPWFDWESLLLDSHGTPHVVWRVAGSNVMYGSRRPDGSWSVPLRISGTGMVGWPYSVIGRDDVIHVAYVRNGRIGYVQRSVSGNWSTEEAGPAVSPSWRMEVDALGAVHIVWDQNNTIYYGQRSVNGAWLPPQVVVTNVSGLSYPQMVVEPGGGVHLLWSHEVSGQHDVFHAYRTTSGVWSVPVNLSTSPQPTSVTSTVLSDGAILNLVYNDGTMDEFTKRYRTRTPDGVWSVPIDLANYFAQTSTPAPWILIDDNRLFHVVIEAGVGFDYVEFMPGGPTAPPEHVSTADTGAYIPANFTGAVDSKGTFHLISSDYSGILVYARRSNTGEWSGIQLLPGGIDVGYMPHIVADTFDDLHILRRVNNSHLAYIGPELATTNGESFISQTLVVPPGSINPTLSFLYKSAGISPGRPRQFFVQIDDGGGPTTVFSTTTGSDEWMHQWVDLTPWADRNVTVRFVLQQVAGEPRTAVYLDEISVGSAHPDLWVQPSSAAAGPGQQFSYLLDYGNHGGVDAANGSVKLQLPAGLTFVSADPPPTATTPVLRWDVGNMPAFSQQTINLTLQMAESAPYGSTLNTTAGIVSDTAELETINNTASGPVFVGSRSWLPFVVR